MAKSKEDIHRLAASVDCAYYASSYLTGPTEEPYNGRFLLGAHHLEWSKIVRSSNKACILAPRDHGKCMIGTDRIVTPTGELVMHKDWKGGMVLSFDEETKSIRPAYASPAVSQGIKPVLFIKTRSGREMTVTWNHPLFTETGWVEARFLQPGDNILAVASYENSIKIQDPKPIEHPWLLGVVVGDGESRKRSVVKISSRRQLLRDALMSEMSSGSLELDGVQLAPGSFEFRNVKKWMSKYGLWHKVWWNKDMPKQMFTASNKDIAEFLSGFIDTDGATSPDRCELASENEQFIKDAQHLFLRMGIVGLLRDYSSGRIPSWGVTRLRIFGHSLDKIRELLHLRSGKLSKIATSDRRSYRGYYSPELMWDPIAEIHSCGEAEVFAVDVPGPRNYIAEDVVQHNSAFFSWAYPIWQMDRSPGFDKENYGYIFSATESQAIKMLNDIIAEIEGNPTLAHLLPKNKRVKWGGKMIQCANGHRIYARGWGSKTRGAHPKWIILDDVLNDEDAFSEEVRNKNVNYFRSAIIPMVPPNGQLLIVGTPYSANDLYGVVSKTKDFYFKRFQALNKEGPLWPERYSSERLLARRDEVGALSFAREYMCEVIDAASSLFPLGLTMRSDMLVVDAELGMPRPYWLERGIQRFFIGVDFAISANVKADYTVIFTVGVDKFDNRWVVNIVHTQGADFQHQIDLIRREAMIYNPELVCLETNQMQKIFEQELTRISDLPIRGMHTGSDKHSLREGVPAMRMLFENGKYRIPRGSEASVKLTDKWLAELTGLTIVKGQVSSVAAHDDLPMAQYICEKGIRSSAFNFSFNEEVGDEAAYQQEMAGMDLPGILDTEFHSGDMDIDRSPDTVSYGRDYSKRHQGEGLVEPSEIIPEDRVSQSRIKKAPELEPIEKVVPGNGAPTMLDMIMQDPWNNLW